MTKLLIEPLITPVVTVLVNEISNKLLFAPFGNVHVAVYPVEKVHVVGVVENIAGEGMSSVIQLPLITAISFYDASYG